MAESAIKIENLKKRYRLGAIGGQTLNAELQSWWARKRGKEDPNLKLGETYDGTNKEFWALKGINLEVISVSSATALTDGSVIWSLHGSAIRLSRIQSEILSQIQIQRYRQGCGSYLLSFPPLPVSFAV